MVVYYLFWNYRSRVDGHSSSAGVVFIEQSPFFVLKWHGYFRHDEGILSKIAFVRSEVISWKQRKKKGKQVFLQRIDQRLTGDNTGQFAILHDRDRADVLFEHEVDHR